MNSKKIILLSSLLSFILLLCPGFVRAFSIVYDFWISYIAYFTVTLLLLNKYGQYKKTITLSFIFTLLSLYCAISIVEHHIPKLGIPSLIGFIIATFSSYLFFINKNIFSKLFIIMYSCFICVFYVFWGYDQWLNYLNFGNFNQRIKKTISSNWFSYVNIDSTLFIAQNNKKIFLLDFYNTGCGVCFRKFPILEQTYNKYKNDSGIAIYAVNIPWPRDTPGMAINVIRGKKYTFPILLGKPKLDSFFGILAYPTTILLRNDTVLFKGDIEQAGKPIEQALGR